jgi:hypothetical protein
VKRRKAEVKGKRHYSRKAPRTKGAEDKRKNAEKDQNIGKKAEGGFHNRAQRKTKIKMERRKAWIFTDKRRG